MSDSNVRPSVDDYFGDWKQREALVQEMIPVIGKMFNRYNIGIYIYGRPLHNRSVTFIMKSHRFVRQVERNEMSEFESHPVLMAMAKLDLCHANIDLGKLTVRFMEHLEAEGDAADEQEGEQRERHAARHALPVAHDACAVPATAGRGGWRRLRRAHARPRVRLRPTFWIFSNFLLQKLLKLFVQIDRELRE